MAKLSTSRNKSSSEKREVIYKLLKYRHDLVLYCVSVAFSQATTFLELRVHFIDMFFRQYFRESSDDLADSSG